MIDDKKSTDPGLSAAERKTLRNREAREAIADHEEAQRALHGNLERLREERLAREAAAGPMLYPAPELPDDTPIADLFGYVPFQRASDLRVSIAPLANAVAAGSPSNTRSTISGDNQARWIRLLT